MAANGEAVLPPPCPQCGTLNGPLVEQCLGCGLAVAGPVSAPPPAPPMQGWGAPPYAMPYPPPAPFPPPAPLYGPPLAYFPYAPPPLGQTLGRLASPYRWGASVIDLVIMYGSWNLIVVSLLLAGRFDPAIFLVVVVGVYFWAYAYYALQDAFAGGTIGKHLLGLTLVDQKLGRIRARQGAARALEVFLWLFTVIIGMTIIQWVLVRKGGQGVGDRLVGTYVVRKRALVEVGARPSR